MGVGEGQQNPRGSITEKGEWLHEESVQSLSLPSHAYSPWKWAPPWHLQCKVGVGKYPQDKGVALPHWGLWVIWNPKVGTNVI